MQSMKSKTIDAFFANVLKKSLPRSVMEDLVRRAVHDALRAALTPVIQSIEETITAEVREAANDRRERGRQLNNSGLLTVKEAVKYSSISHSKIYELLGDGKIGARKIGRKTMIEKASIDEYLASLPVAYIGKHQR
jgi:excisionase family DNA binding protein